jgi:hypothetical protein
MILTLCGSVRFRKQFEEVAADLSCEGHVVLSLNVWGTDIDDADPLKVVLETAHLKKIDLAQGIVVINVGGYVGNSTRNEISYARKTGKQVFWYEILQAPLEINLHQNDLTWKALKKVKMESGLAKDSSEAARNSLDRAEAPEG